MIEASKLATWFRPTAAAGQWITDGTVAVLVTDKPALDLRVIPEDAMATLIDAQPVESAVVTRPVDGYVVMGEMAFDAYKIDLVLAAYPRARWELRGFCATAVVDDKPVGLVAKLTGTPGELGGADPPPPPPCPTCDGYGGDECPECEGSGSIECTCHCGDVHEHECKKCDGEGIGRNCSDCGGSGKWKPAEPS